MAIAKLVGAQRDFSAGELDQSTKRADENPIVKTGGRQMSNWRILSSRALANRPGRSALFMENGRVEEITMPKGNVFFLLFNTNVVKIYNAAGSLVFVSAPSYPWTFANRGAITYAIIGYSIYIAYPDGVPNNVPQVLTWDGVSQVSTWTIAGYFETVTPGGQKRTAFYRISPPNITMQPSATNGSVTLTFSGAVLVAGMVGTRFTFCGRQLLLTARSSATVGTATVIEPLPPAQTLALNLPTGAFNVGDEVTGSISGATGIVTGSATTQQIFTNLTTPNFNIGDSVSGGTSGATGTVTGVNYFGGQNPNITVHLSTGTLFVTGEVVTDTTTTATFTSGNVTAGGLTVQLLATATGFIKTFTTSDLVVGPSGSSAISTVTTIAPQPVAVWDDEVMNTFRGYPSSVFADQSRLGFCNVPSVPTAIIWSAIGLPTDLYTGALPDESIFEIAPDQSQVFYVVAGMESAEFVFTDRAIYYIPIGGIVAKPLEPGSVAFIKLSDYGIVPGVQPRRAEQSIVYMKAGATQVGAVQAPGAYYRPYIVDDISDLHSHLFAGRTPIAIAIPSGPTQFSELYIYIAFADGNLVVGRYSMRQGLIEPGPDGRPHVGWLPWTGAGTVLWVAAQQSDVIFMASYLGTGVVERLDATQFLDGALAVNSLPAPFTPPGGKGPLYVFPGPSSSVFLIDLGTRFMGTYQVDANGFLIPQFIGGENLSSPQLVAGQPWTAILEPWAPDAPPGQSSRQRLLRRRVSYMVIRVSVSTGFVMARLFSSPLTRTSPAYGTIMNLRRIPTWNQDDDPTQPPPLREETQRWRPVGRAFDPRVAIIKDTPGSLLVHELGLEVTI